MNMKKYFAVTMIVAGMLIGVSALAATSVTLSPATVSVKAGQTFTVAVLVDPQSVKNYTVELKLNYPADLLQVQSFTFGSQWTPLNQPGYDLTDNTNGVLIKTAGYPQGFSSNAQFGTITFQAQKTGTGVIALASGTMALNQSNQNLFAGSSQVNVSVSALSATAVPTAKPTPKPTATPKASVAPGQPTVQPSLTPTASELTTPTPSIEPAVQQASILGSVGNTFSLGTGNGWIGFIVLLAIIYGIYWVIKRMLRK
jgi:hypothetical protein